VAGITLLLAVLLAPCSSGRSGIPDRIILIVIDTLRRDHLSCYGGDTPTPSIDALAKTGQIFTNAYSSFHQTSMSMASLMTGHTPSLEIGKGRKAVPWTVKSWCGLYRFANPDGDSCVPQKLETIAEVLRDAGYWTIGVASNPILYKPDGYSQGFQDWVELEGVWYGGKKPERYTKYTLPPQAFARTGEYVNRGVKLALERRKSDHFFLFVHYMDVHDYVHLRVPYEKGVSEADFWVGQLLADLEDAGLLKDAVVVLTSDHGERLREQHFLRGTPGHYGNPSFEYLLKVPLIVSPPRFEDTSIPLRSDDVFRMLKHIAGIPDEGKPDLARDEVFVSEINWITFRKGPWKSFQDRRSKKTYFVNLERDPGETRNVAAENAEALEAHLKRAAALSRALATPPVKVEGIAERDRDRLKSLGYLQ
jgi:arylsulfatase A-like enzyme